MSPEDRREIVRVAHQISRFSGPLPPPEDLANYERVLPGSADRIICMAEGQATHRQSLEQKVINANVSIQQLGLACAFIIAMTAIVGGIWISLKGMSGTGLSVIIGALGALVGVFVYGKSEQRKELAHNEDALANRREPPPAPPPSPTNV